MSIGRDDDFVVLPDTTSDETDRGWGDDHEPDDARLLDDRPPHWG